MKKEFTVSIYETLKRDITVMAETEDKARDIVDKLYSDQEIVLSGDDFIEFEMYESFDEHLRPVEKAILLLQQNDPNGSWEEIETKDELVETLQTALEEGRDKEIEEFYKDILAGLDTRKEVY